MRSLVDAIRVVAFTHAPATDRSSGLLAFVTLDFGLVRTRATIRRSRMGRTYVSFPDRVDQHGRRRALITPINRAARAVIEGAVLDALGKQGLFPILGDTNTTGGAP